MKLMIRSENPYVLVPEVFSQTPSEGALCAKWAHQGANLTISVNHGTPPFTLNISLQLDSVDGT